MGKLDIRTHLIILGMTTVLWFLLHGKLAIHGMLLLSVCYLSYEGHWKQGVQFVGTYIILVLIAELSVPYAAILYIILNTFARSIPLMVVAAAIVDANPSSLIGSCQKIYMPKYVLVMICILLRFFSVLCKEMLIIRDGIRARGLFPRWYHYLRHPLMAYECFFVPLVMRCLKLSSELGASAELRGLDSSCKRSCIYPIGFRLRDAIAIILYAIGEMVIYVGVGR